MKTRGFIFLLLGLIANLGVAQADEYTWDLSNLTVGEQPSNFAPKDWGHIDDSFYGEPTYTYKANSIYCTSQGTFGDDYSHNDLLVTPAVGGTVTMKVKDETEYQEGTIHFFKCTKSGDTYTRGDQMDVTVPSLSSDYQTITIYNVPSGTYIGIRLSQVTMRDFTASEAGVVKRSGLTVSDVESLNGKFVDVDENGNFKLSYSVKVKNSGDFDLNADTTGYSISLLVGSKPDTVATAAIPTALAKGAESDAITLSATLKESDYEAPINIAIAENVSNTQKKLSAVSPVPHKAIIALKADGKDIANGDTLSFGTIKADTTKTISIINNGAAEQNYSSIEVPEGFSSSNSGPVTISAHDTLQLSVTASVAETGKKAGWLKVSDNNGEELKIWLESNVIDPSTYYVDFEDNKLGEGMIQEDWSVKKVNDTYAAYNYYTSDKLITPKLAVGEKDSISFDVARYSTSSYSSPSLSVYYSTDRTNWVLAKTFTSDVFQKVTGSYFSGYTYPFTTLTVDNIPEGEYYIAFDGAYMYLDNIVGYKQVAVEHDVAFTSITLPESASVNTKANISARIKNYAKTEAAGKYSISLVVGGETVATLADTELTAETETSISFDFIPHKAGKFETYFEFKAGDYSIASAKDSIIISPEKAESEKQIGTRTEGNSSAPVNSTASHNAASMLYKASDLKLAEGTKILGFAFKGVSSRYDVDMSNLKVWIEQTDKEDQGSTIRNLTSSATLVFDNKATIKGDRSGNTTNLMSFTLPEPIIYDGTNIRITFKADVEYADYNDAVNFDADRNIGTTIYGGGDSEPSSLDKTADATPVLYLTISETPDTLTGTITSGKTKIADAVVLLKSGDVQYSDTTDANGNYTIPVMQKDLEYELSVSKDGYRVYTDSIIFENAKTVKDIELVRSIIVKTDKDVALPADSCKAEFVISHTFVSGYNTVILPFEPKELQQLFDFEIYELNSVQGNNVFFKKIDVDTAKANVPYVIKVDNKVELVDSSLTATFIPGNAQTVTISGEGSEVKLIPNLNKAYIMTADNYTIAGDGNLQKNSDYDYVSNLSAYLTINGIDQDRLTTSYGDRVPDGIDHITTDKTVNKSIYTINGIKVKNATKGIYIINGKKVVVK